MKRHLVNCIRKVFASDTVRCREAALSGGKSETAKGAAPLGAGIEAFCVRT